MPIAVVTGASSGIGAAICRKLLSSTTEKWKIIMIARTESKMKAVANNNQQNVLIIPCDVSIPKNIIQNCIPTIQNWLKQQNTEYIDVLINNVGGIVSADSNTLECNLDDWNKIMDLNLTSTWLFTKYMLPYINNSKNNKYKSIVNIGSISGDRASDTWLTYHVSKSAVAQFTKCAALHCANKYKNIRINCLAPGWIETGLHQKFMGKGVADGARNLFVSMTPLGKVGTEDDIVNATEFLMNSQKSGWITGQVIRMDGGMSLPQVQSVNVQSKL
eukprot:20563_1